MNCQSVQSFLSAHPVAHVAAWVFLFIVLALAIYGGITFANTARECLANLAAALDEPFDIG
jgi:outer membrane lipoprotein-sorting protein